MASKSAEKELVKLERQYWQALKDRDWNAALRLSDDPTIVVGAQGVGKVAKKSILEMMKHANYTLDEFLECFPSVTREMACRVLECSEARLFDPAPA